MVGSNFLLNIRIWRLEVRPLTTYFYHIQKMVHQNSWVYCISIWILSIKLSRYIPNARRYFSLQSKIVRQPFTMYPSQTLQTVHQLCVSWIEDGATTCHWAQQLEDFYFVLARCLLVGRRCIKFFYRNKKTVRRPSAGPLNMIMARQISTVHVNLKVLQSNLNTNC